MILPFLFSQSLCQANVNSPEAVADSASKMGTFLLDFYTNNPGPDGFGAILPSSASDVSGQQWYESGIFWGAIMDYQMIFKDTKFAETCSTALGLASGRSGSFLGDNKLLSATLLGKWNDDIAWWALAAMTGAEIYGPDAKLPSGNTYLKVAQITYDQIWEQHDDLCGGGIYWSRDRSSARSKGYKSTITSIYLIFNYLDAQAIMLGARLYRMTKNETYLKQAQGLADWLKTSGIINSQGQVYDGIDADTGCSVKQPFHSYIAGTYFHNLRDCVGRLWLAFSCFAGFGIFDRWKSSSFAV
jgi:mannan endo-1,6-alpha-mannosidase